VSSDVYPAGSLELGRVPEIWAAIDEAWQVAQKHRDESPSLLITARKLDMAQPAGHRVYIEAWRRIQYAMENQQALQALLRFAGATPWAPWNLLRPTFEAAFYALWVLEPDQGLTRRQRALRLELNDQRERWNFWGELGKLPGPDGRKVRDDTSKQKTDVDKVYRKEALSLGVVFSKAGAKVDVTEEVGKLRAANLSPETKVLYKATWRSLSGYQHGYGYAVMTGSDVRIAAPMAGGHLAKVEINDEMFQTSAQATAWLLLSALQLWVRRSTRHD
jgi:hypothetical protein